MDTETILEQVGRIKELPTLPVIAFEVNRMLMNPNTSIDSLSDAIKKDQAIVSKILKLVNSAFYGARSKVSTVNEAVIRLGFNSVRNIVVSISVFDVFKLQKNLDLDFNIDDFWKHSVGVALISKYLSDQTGLQDPDDCFVSGLLHDIGLIILLEYFPGVMKEIIILSKEKNLSIYDAEKQVLQIRHNKIGELIAKKWQLPVSLCDTLKYHHIPVRGASNPELVAIIHLADVICNRFVVTSINPKKDNRQPMLSNIRTESAKLLDKYYRYAEDWFPELFEKIKDACHFFMNQ